MNVPDILSNILHFLDSKDNKNIFTLSKLSVELYKREVKKYANINNRLKNIFEDRYDDIIKHMKRTNAFISGSFVLESLHAKNFSNSDIDIYCGCNSKVLVEEIYLKCSTLTKEDCYIEDFIKHINDFITKMNAIYIEAKELNLGYREIKAIINERMSAFIEKLIYAKIILKHLIYNKEKVLEKLCYIISNSVGSIDHKLFPPFRSANLRPHKWIRNLLEFKDYSCSCSLYIYMQDNYDSSIEIDKNIYGKNKYVSSFICGKKKVQIIHHNVYMEKPEDATETFYATLVMNYWNPNDPNAIYSGYPTLTMNYKSLVLYNFNNKIHSNCSSDFLQQCSLKDMISGENFIEATNCLLYCKLLYLYTNLMCYHYYYILSNGNDYETLALYIESNLNAALNGNSKLDYIKNNTSYIHYGSLVCNTNLNLYYHSRIVSSDKHIIKAQSVFIKSSLLNSFINIITEKRKYINEKDVFMYIIGNTLIDNFNPDDNDKIYELILSLIQVFRSDRHYTDNTPQFIGYIELTSVDMKYDFKVLEAIKKYKKRGNEHLIPISNYRPLLRSNYLGKYSRSSIIENIFKKEGIDIRSILAEGDIIKYRRVVDQTYNKDTKKYFRLTFKHM
ncbi:hypothetical protein HDU92_008462 [Lobulomyces angularis]|nr:hypothetical protein HDU92_008462 [Lobulomyces angularis]